MVTARMGWDKQSVCGLRRSAFVAMVKSANPRYGDCQNPAGQNKGFQTAVVRIYSYALL